MLESSALYARWVAKLTQLNGYPDLADSFARLRRTVSEQSKIIVRIFPEYTPHDSTRHLEQLFHLADKVLGADLYDRLNVAELSLLVFGLYAHDWGMALSNDERAAISGLQMVEDAVLIPDEIQSFRRFRDEAVSIGKSNEQIWEDYLRQTHAQRSGCRLRKELDRLSRPFAEMVARVAEGHVLDLREIRDPERYPLQTALLGDVANVAAVATYVRVVDLLDIGEDRTPLALWSIVRPHNEISRMEWHKHRTLAPVAISERTNDRQVLVCGTTDDPDVFAALADLRSWVDAQFAESVAFLCQIGNRYDLNLDSTVKWDIKAIGFEPLLLRFDFDRSAALGLLSTEVYGHKQLTFVRELLQNSIDAIDTRAELLRQSDATLDGRISVNITTLSDVIRIEWTDNGVGMDRYILENYFARIGRSWYQSPDFRRRSLTHDPVSKFGVGLLSCFGISPSLIVITRREPLLARDFHGWRLHIPSREGHFRVKVDDQLAVGTTIVLDVHRRNTELTAATIASTIKHTAELVRYKILLRVDGLDEAIEPVTPEDDPRLPFLRISSLDDAALASLRSSTVEFSHRYRSPSGGYEAFFSCVLPRDVSSITSIESKEWHLGSETINFDDFIVHQPERLFIKGVVSGTERDAHPPGNLNALALNILKPSLVQPDLSRSHIDVGSLNLDEVWSDVAPRIRQIVAPHFLSVEDRVRALSVASQIAGFPDEALAYLVPRNSWPVWMLQDGSGTSWREASVILENDEVLEAPEDVEYVLSTREHFASALPHVQYWSGPRLFRCASVPLGALVGRSDHSHACSA